MNLITHQVSYSHLGTKDYKRPKRIAPSEVKSGRKIKFMDIEFRYDIPYNA